MSSVAAALKLEGPGMFLTLDSIAIAIVGHTTADLGLQRDFRNSPHINPGDTCGLPEIQRIIDYVINTSF